MANFATATDALTAGLATVDARLRNIDVNEKLELYIELADDRATIQQAIGASGGGGSSSTITTNTSIDYNAGITTAKTTRIVPATDAIFTVSQAPVVPAFLFTSAITRVNNVNGYAANTVYGGALQLISSVAPLANQWIIITDIEIIFNLAALPTTLRMPAGKWAFRVTHRFTRNLGDGDFGDAARGLKQAGHPQRHRSRTHALEALRD